MKIIDVFDAARDGTYEQFRKCYTGNINEISKDLGGLNLLSLALVNNNKESDKIKIIKFLLSEKIDLTFIDKKAKRSVLHVFYFNVLEASAEYLLEVTKLLIEAGVDINGEDKYGATPLKYAITLTKLETDEMIPIYQYFLENGADYKHKDMFGKSCLDYAKEYSWRNGFIQLVGEYENGKQK